MRESILDRLLLEKSLTVVNQSGLSGAAEYAIEHDDGNRLVKNVCAKVSPVLADRIDNVCGILQLNKRAFLEAAFIDACDRAEKTMREEGVYQSLMGDVQEVSA